MHQSLCRFYCAPATKSMASFICNVNHSLLLHVDFPSKLGGQNGGLMHGTLSKKRPALIINKCVFAYKDRVIPRHYFYQ